MKNLLIAMTLMLSLASCQENYVANKLSEIDSYINEPSETVGRKGTRNHLTIKKKPELITENIEEQELLDSKIYVGQWSIKWEVLKYDPEYDKFFFIDIYEEDGDYWMYNSMWGQSLKLEKILMFPLKTSSLYYDPTHSEYYEVKGKRIRLKDSFGYMERWYATSLN